MNEQRPSLFMPAVIGGTIAGVLSSVPFLNCLCCMWIVGGAILAAALWAKDSQASLKAGDGALVGAYTGVFAAIAHTLVGIPMAAVNSRFFMRMFERLSEYTNEMPNDWRQWFDQGAIAVSIPGFLLNLVISAAVFCLLGVLGGVLGAALFGKKTPPSGFIQPPVPPPPQSPAA
ncbi:MAG: hypothetical protein JW843_05710 [Candidatus Aminicenantes bacterium]|nr:hypothetical protein [Candidatus Aminicenantes bacterium]